MTKRLINPTEGRVPPAAPEKAKVGKTIRDLEQQNQSRPIDDAEIGAGYRRYESVRAAVGGVGRNDWSPRGSFVPMAGAVLPLLIGPGVFLLTKLMETVVEPLLRAVYTRTGLKSLVIESRISDRFSRARRKHWKRGCAVLSLIAATVAITPYASPVVAYFQDTYQLAVPWAIVSTAVVFAVAVNPLLLVAFVAVNVLLYFGFLILSGVVTLLGYALCLILVHYVYLIFDPDGRWSFVDRIQAFLFGWIG